MKLSHTMLEVLRRLLRDGGRLYPWPGGFWTTQPAPEGWRSGWPTGRWYASTNTVRAMERHGLLERCFEDTREWRDVRRITEAGRQAVEADG